MELANSQQFDANVVTSQQLDKIVPFFSRFRLITHNDLLVLKVQQYPLQRAILYILHHSDIPDRSDNFYHVKFSEHFCGALTQFQVPSQRVALVQTSSGFEADASRKVLDEVFEGVYELVPVDDTVD